MNCLPRKQSIFVWFESIRLISFHNLFYLTIVWRLHVRAYFQGYICLSVDCRSLVISLTTIVVKIMGQLNAQRAELNIIYDGTKKRHLVFLYDGHWKCCRFTDWTQIVLDSNCPAKNCTLIRMMWWARAKFNLEMYRNEQKKRARLIRPFAHSLVVNLTSFYFYRRLQLNITKIVPFLAIMRWIECNDANDRHHLYWLMWLAEWRHESFHFLFFLHRENKTSTTPMNAAFK